MFNPALSLQQIVGINPYTGERPLESQNMIQILIIAYGVHAKAQMTNNTQTIFASLFSISTYKDNYFLSVLRSTKS